MSTEFKRDIRKDIQNAISILVNNNYSITSPKGEVYYNPLSPKLQAESNTTTKIFSGMVQTVCEKHDFVSVCYTDNFKTHQYEQCRNCGAPNPQADNKDWEIVQYGYCQNNEGKPEQQYIHSIKKLSDNTVWSVGDDSNWGKITGFEISDNKIKVLYYAKGDWQFLQSVTKKSPTEQPKENIVMSVSETPMTDLCIIKYTQQQMDEAIEKAFNAAREFDGYGYTLTGWGGSLESMPSLKQKYPTYQDYKQSKQ